MTQRDIKFRAWSDRVCQFNYYKLEEIGVGIYEGSIIQQYTGLNDINQKDIYEGDIVKYQYQTGLSDPNFYEASGEIYFGQGSFKVNGMLLGEGTYILNPIVIGNIFESPELLDDTKISSNLPKRCRGRPKKEIF
jgi:hypothetical protein